MSATLQVLIEGEPLDLFASEEKSFYVSKEIYNLNDLETRNSGVTKSTIVPLTRRNKRLLALEIPSLSKHARSTAQSSIPCEVLMQGVPIVEDALLIISEQDPINKTVRINIFFGTASFFNQLSVLPINAIPALEDYNMEWTLAGIAAIISNTEGMVYADSIWHDNTSERFWQADPNYNIPIVHLDEIELGESGYFFYCHTMLDLIFASLTNITVDTSKMDDAFFKIAMAVPVPIIHDAFQSIEGTYGKVTQDDPPMLLTPLDPIYNDMIVMPFDTVVNDLETIWVAPDRFTFKKVGSYRVTINLVVATKNLGPQDMDAVRVTLQYKHPSGASTFVIFADSSVVVQPVGGAWIIFLDSSVEAQIGTEIVVAYIVNVAGASQFATFTVQSLGEGRGTTLDVPLTMPETRQRDFVLEIFKLFNIVPTQRDNVVTLNYFNDVRKATPVEGVRLDFGKAQKITTVLTKYAQNNILQYEENEDVERLDSSSEFPVNSISLASDAVLIQSKFSATDKSAIQRVTTDERVVIPEYELTVLYVTDNRLTISLNSPLYTSEDRTSIRSGDFIAFVGSTMRRRVIETIDDFSGTMDVDSNQQQNVTEWWHWSFNQIGVKNHLVEIIPSTNDLVVRDGGFVQTYANSQRAEFTARIRFDSLLVTYYDLIRDSVFKPYVIQAWTSLSVLEFISIDGLSPIYIEEQDAYFYMNRMEQWKMDESVRITLIELNL